MVTKASLLCLAGWGFSNAVWGPLHPYLADYFELICCDLRSMTGDLDAWLDALAPQLPDSFSIVGWSLGGLIAQYMAKRFPGRVAHVLAVCSSPYFPAENNWPGITHERLDLFQSASQEAMSDLLRQFSRWQVPLRDREAMAVIKRSLLTEDDQVALQNTLQVLLTLDMRGQVKPCHFLLADQDALLPVSLAACLTGGVHVVPGTHGLPVSQPDLVAAWVREILHA